MAKLLTITLAIFKKIILNILKNLALYIKKAKYIREEILSL
jgi:hypothetical protein